MVINNTIIIIFYPKEEFGNNKEDFGIYANKIIIYKIFVIVLW